MRIEREVEFFFECFSCHELIVVDVIKFDVVYVLYMFGKLIHSD